MKQVTQALALMMVPVAWTLSTPAVTHGQDASVRRTPFEAKVSACEVVINPLELRRVSRRRVDFKLSAETESDVPLMNGQWTLAGWTIQVGGRAASARRFIFAHFRFTPRFGSGSLRGTLVSRLGSPSAFVGAGRGEGDLSGVSVTLRSGPLEDALVQGQCAGLALSGRLRVARRPDPVPAGMVIVESEASFPDTRAELRRIVENNPNLRIVAELDHAANAARAGLELLPTTELFFGNPRLGTPLMQCSQTAGIDLPQKMLVWEDLFGTVYVGYNLPAYLKRRHGLQGVDNVLETIEGALASIARAATQDGTARTGPTGGRDREGLVVRRSHFDVDETFSRLTTAIENAPPNILFALEHDQNAASVGLSLGPTKLIVFGNPALGTPLMQQVQSVGIDLPQKFLVWETHEGVFVGWNDPFYVAQRHGVMGQDERLEIIAGALRGLAETASNR